jgi:gliding motility-associated-like protein
MKRIMIYWLILLPILTFSQNEAAIWYFGQNAGLDFNSGSPVVLTDGQLSTFEGCATISDAAGNLLFYTDGITVYDKNHNIMPNGTGLNGNPSSSQSAIIVPKPNNPDQYYIFTADENVFGSTDNNMGINYSIVDLTLNGGNGDITTKNVPLIANGYEKVMAIKHANNNSFWLLTFIDDTFYAWQIDATGINAPITSTVTTGSPYASRGYLKISNDGSKIACANFGPGGKMRIYDFNTSTGFVSIETTLNFNDTKDIPYGVEFSPQTQRLYVTTCQLNGNYPTTPGKLYQFDLMNANNRTLIDSSNIISRCALQLAIDGKIYRALANPSTTQDTSEGTNYLGAIETPELLATDPAFSYNPTAVDVTIGGTYNAQVYEGLPPFVSSFFSEPNITANDVCFGLPTQFNFNSSSPPTTITWDFGDPTSGVDNTSTLENPTHIFTSSGVFTVTATGTIGANPFNLTLDITIYDSPVVISPVTLTKCDDNFDGIENFNLEDANPLISTNYLNETFTYYTDSIAAVNADSNALISNQTSFSNGTQSTVWARVENTVECFETAQINLEVTSVNIPSSLMLNYKACDNDSDGDDTNGITSFDFSSATNQILNALLPETDLIVTYYETIDDAKDETKAINPSNYTNTTANTQQIVVRVDKTTNTCFDLGFHVTLNVNPVPAFDLPPSVTLCLNSSGAIIGVENPLDNYTYLWTNSNGDNYGTTQQINVDTEDTYTVTATDTNGNNCQKSKSIQVIAAPIQPLPSFGLNNIEIVDSSANNSITVNTNNLPDSNYEFALDSGNFQTENVFQNVSGGLHTVKIRDVDNCLEASVEVNIISIPNFFTPNNDGSNDTWQVTGIDNQPNSKIYVFDRFGKLIAILNPLGNGWNGLYKGNPLPSTDYWYRVELEDGRLFQGHFSLIRK